MYECNCQDHIEEQESSEEETAFPMEKNLHNASDKNVLQIPLFVMQPGTQKPLTSMVPLMMMMMMKLSSSWRRKASARTLVQEL
jgi:hypothetical protein